MLAGSMYDDRYSDLTVVGSEDVEDIMIRLLDLREDFCGTTTHVYTNNHHLGEWFKSVLKLSYPFPKLLDVILGIVLRFFQPFLLLQ